MGMANGRLLFYGLAERRSKPEEALHAALEDAARKVAIFYGAEGYAVRESAVGAATFDYREASHTALVYDTDLQKYLSLLEYDPEHDVFEDRQALMVRAWLRDPGPAPAYQSASGSTRPAWTHEAPAIPGFETGVGYAGHRSSFKDTVNASFESALFAIIANRSNAVQSSTTQYQGPGSFDYGSRTETVIASHARVEGFYALAMWEDPVDKSLWTLGAARP
jgi:hypothetical protein